MKNNILLIAAVTIISVAVIAVVIVLSAGGKDSDPGSSAQSSDVISDSIPEERDETESAQQPVLSDASAEETVTAETAASTEETEQLIDATGIVDMARSLIGIPFAEGGETPESGFDNSGFIYYVLRENGYITCPRGVSAQSQMGTQLSYGELKVGDLVFFANESGTGAGFGGIYAGNGIMIACLMPGTSVKEVDISGTYYTNNFFCGVSLS